MKRLGISYDQLFRACPGHYMVLLPSRTDQIVIEANDDIVRLLGIPREDLLNRRLKDVIGLGKQNHNHVVESVMVGMQQAIATNEPCDLGAMAFYTTRKVPQPENLHTVMYPLASAGVIAGVILSISTEYDLSDERHHQEHVQRLEHLIEVNRTKDDFISIASHQLRTPATGVKQYLGMLRDGMFGKLSATQKEILDRAYESNERQLTIVTDLLKVAQVDGGKISLRFEGVDMDRLVEHVIEDARETFTVRKQTIKFKPSSRLAIVSVDADTIRMVIENVLDNAGKYSEEGTRIDVAVHDNKTSVKVFIKDQGVGISPAERAQLFEKFSRIDNILSTKVGGTGLGLYWAKRVIDLHGGKIAYKPNKPQGSIFEITLPKQSNL